MMDGFRKFPADESLGRRKGGEFSNRFWLVQTNIALGMRNDQRKSLNVNPVFC